MRSAATASIATVTTTIVVRWRRKRACVAVSARAIFRSSWRRWRMPRFHSHGPTESDWDRHGEPFAHHWFERMIGTVDALETYARAGESGDVDLLLSAYAENGALRSPIIGRATFRGHDDIRRVMTEVYRVARHSTFRLRARDG